MKAAVETKDDLERLLDLYQKDVDEYQIRCILEMVEDERRLREKNVSHLWWDKEKEEDVSNVGRIVCVKKNIKYW